MSLLVWLPLMKDLRQQGVDSSTITGNNVTINTSGKLGQCYSFNGTNSYLISSSSPFSNNTDNWSFACWLKPNTSHNACLFCCRTGINNTGISIFYYSGQIIFDDGTRWQFTPSTSISVNNWNHLVFIRKKGVGKFLYLNGILINSTTTTGTQSTVGSRYTIGASQDSVNSVNANYLNGFLNDVRIYDHCLSQMEVKELSKGLVLHYPLSGNSIQSLDNCYVYPRFETSNSNGGWLHWGSSGHVGTYGQTTDTNYIFRNGQTYVHWVADGSSATKNYLLYQSPAFEGGYRSLQCICKEENSLPISESIVYPAWNARNGGVPSNTWTSVTPLGDGFYHCKCEGISQDGSDDLVGFYVRAGYKVYFSEAYVENDRTVCSDIFYPTNTIYDTSGFCNNATINGNFTVSMDTPKYNLSTVFNGTEWIKGDTPGGEILTLACWAKTSKNKSTSQFMVADSTSQLCISFYSNCIISYFSSSGQSTGSRCTLGSAYKENDWNHFVVVKTGTGTRKVYCNGVEQTATSNDYWGSAAGLFIGSRNDSGSLPFYGELCDIRAYATALSADDVKSLYQNSAYIDSSGNVYGTIHEV